MLFSKLRTKNVVYGMGEGLAKFWMVIASAIIGINLFLILTLMQMAPKLQVIAQILTTSPMQSNQLLQTEPFSYNTGDKKLIDETLVRFYIDSRYTTFQDKDEMQSRWGGGGPIARLSTRDVYQKFAGNLKDKLTEINNSNVTTSVDIVSISRIDNIFTIEFDIYTYGRGNVRSQRKVAVVTVGYNPGRRFFSTRYSNPFGMFVKSYQETVKKG